MMGGQRRQWWISDFPDVRPNSARQCSWGMARYLIEFHLSSDTRAELAQLARVIRSARLRIERDSHEPCIDAIGLVSNGQRTYCVVRARSTRQVGRLTDGDAGRTNSQDQRARFEALAGADRGGVRLVAAEPARDLNPRSQPQLVENVAHVRLDRAV